MFQEREQKRRENVRNQTVWTRVHLLCIETTINNDERRRELQAKGLTYRGIYSAFFKKQTLHFLEYENIEKKLREKQEGAYSHRRFLLVRFHSWKHSFFYLLFSLCTNLCISIFYLAFLLSHFIYILPETYFVTITSLSSRLRKRVFMSECIHDFTYVFIYCLYIAYSLSACVQCHTCVS